MSFLRSRMIMLGAAVLLFSSISADAARRTNRKSTRNTETPAPQQTDPDAPAEDQPENSSISSSNEWSLVLNSRKSGMDQTRLKALTSFITKMKSVMAVAVTYKGKFVYSYGDIKVSHPLKGAASGFTSSAYGILIELGRISLKKSLVDYGIADMPPQVRLDHLLSCRMGYLEPAQKGQWHPKDIKPGTCFIPSQWDMDTAQWILCRQTKRTFGKLVSQVFARPLKMQDFNSRARTAKSSSKYAVEQLMMSTRDLLRFGEMIRCSGKWNGRMIVPENWLRRMVNFQPETADLPPQGQKLYNKKLYSGFGYGWWLLADEKQDSPLAGGYSAGDGTGEYLTILPAAKMVIILRSRKGDPISPENARKIIQGILSCRTSK